MKAPPFAKHVRNLTGLSQEAFSLRFGIPLRTLQEWEQGRREPDVTTLSYLRVIEKIPNVVAKALSEDE